MDSLLDLQFSTTAIVGLFAFFFYHLFCSFKKKKSSVIAPEAGGAWPIIGHLHLLGEKEVPHLVFGTMADKYGPIFTLRLGIHRALVVSNWEMAKECHTTNDLAFATRPYTIAMEHLCYNDSMFGFASYGPYWREVRKIAILELLSNRRLEMLKHVRISEIETCIQDLYKLWVNNKNPNKGSSVLVDMKRWFGDLTLNIVLRMVAGKRYFGAGADCDKEESQRCQKAIRDFFHLVGLFVISDALPFLRWLDLQGHEKAMKKTAKELDSILQRWLDEHKERRLSGENSGEEDFMDLMISILEKATISNFDVDTINKSTSMNLILGGNDTTVVTLTWAVSLLLNNPHTLKRAQEELDSHIGKDRHVDESDIKNLVYLQAIVKETLRLYPAAPLSGPHEAREDCIVAGYHVPAGTRLVVNISKIQRDPRVWPEPLEFRPERFLTSHVGIDLRGQHFEFIPFGTGRRSCPGMSFALQVVHLTLARLLHAFELVKFSEEDVDMTESAGLTNLKATPLEVFLTPRLPSKIYMA